MRLRSAADALGKASGIETAWLRGAAELVDRGEAERHSVREDAVWLEELAPEARAHKAALLSAWVEAAEALRSAIHVLESERGPLVESLFPAWRGPSLRRHVDQALAAEAELQRRLSSGYVVRRLAELATHAALGKALEALAGAGAAWAAERDRPALTGAEADEMRTRLLAAAGRTAHLLERVRWVVRAALADRPELVDVVFPKRTRPVEPPATTASSPEVMPEAEPPATAPAAPGPEAPVHPEAEPAVARDAPAPDEPTATATKPKTASTKKAKTKTSTKTKPSPNHAPARKRRPAKRS